MRSKNRLPWRLHFSGCMSSTFCLILLALFFSSSARLACASEATDAHALDIPPLLHTASDDGDLVASLEEDMEVRPDDDGIQHPLYEPAFDAFDRSILGRAPAGVTSLANNAVNQINVVAGTTQVFVFENSTIFSTGTTTSRAVVDRELRRREVGVESDGNGEPTLQRRAGKSSKMIYISANTCMQPQAISSGTATTVDVPQLTMYVSSTASNVSPGPNANAGQQTSYVFTEGAVMVSLNATEDVYIGISAPNVSSTLFSGTYNVEVAASVDIWYHSYDNDTGADLVWVDSDASAALLITHNLTDSTDYATDEEVMSRQPYVMFAQNQEDTSINGVKFSYCGLQNYAQIAATKNGKLTSMVETGMTKRGLGNLPKQQFYFSGLNASSSYMGILAALPSNGSESMGSVVAGGGGRVSQATSFTTKGANGNCEVVFNLTFCNETAYAVPSNPTKFANATELAQAYDTYASDMFENFQKALAQIPCEAPSTHRYSLVRTCEDCTAAYKTWLCSVVLPRCSDFNDTAEWLQPRAISQTFPNGDSLPASVAAQFPNTTAYNSSRNSNIDKKIAPGPYKEVLPCDDLCYNLVQSCPASMKFACPLPGQYGFNTSYGRRTEADQYGEVTCNYPGSAHYFSAGPAGPQMAWLWLWLAAAGSVFYVMI